MLSIIILMEGKMELLLISDSKLKIMLSEEDMKKYDLGSEDIDYNNTHTRRALWQILDEAKVRTGFDAASDKILVQLYPSKDGGCELFVTKLGLIPPLAEKNIARSSRVAMLTSRQALYRFETLDDLVLAAKAVRDIDTLRASDAYFCDDGAYYLSLEERSGKGNSVSEFFRILEYGEHISAEMRPYISEHARKIADGDAVSRLASL